MSFYICWSRRTVASANSTAWQGPLESMLLLLLFAFSSIFYLCCLIFRRALILSYQNSYSLPFARLFPLISPTDLLSLITPFFYLSFSLYWVFTKLSTSAKTDILEQIWNLRDQHREWNSRIVIFTSLQKVECSEAAVLPCDFYVRNKCYRTYW